MHIIWHLSESPALVKHLRILNWEGGSKRKLGEARRRRRRKRRKKRGNFVELH